MLAVQPVQRIKDGRHRDFLSQKIPQRVVAPSNYIGMAALQLILDRPQCVFFGNPVDQHHPEQVTFLRRTPHWVRQQVSIGAFASEGPFQGLVMPNSAGSERALDIAGRPHNCAKTSVV